MEGQTGVTFQGALLVLRKFQPPSAMLENVLGLAGQVEEAKKKLALAGYLAIVLMITPIEFGFPQDRPRLYFLCYRNDIVREAGCTPASLQDFADSTFVHIGNRPYMARSILSTMAAVQPYTCL